MIMKSLTKAEEQVMQILWKLKQGFLKDIVEHSHDPKPHSNTVATLLKILVEKGFVEYEVQGRNNIYRPRINKTKEGEGGSGFCCVKEFPGIQVLKRVLFCELKNVNERTCQRYQ